MKEYSVKHLPRKGQEEKTVVVKADSDVDAGDKMQKWFPDCIIIDVKENKKGANVETEKALITGEKKEDAVFMFDAGYHEDSAGRIRIPTHERKKVFRAMYPTGALVASTPNIDREKGEARGRCELKIDRNDMHPVSTAEAFCSIKELKQMGFDPNHYAETAETQAIGRALTNLAIPQFLHEVQEERTLLLLDQTNSYVKKYMAKVNGSIEVGKIKINDKLQINISSDIRKVTKFKKGDTLEVVVMDSCLKLISGKGKKIQSNYRFLLGKTILDHGFRMGVFDYEMKEGELCLLKKRK